MIFRNQLPAKSFHEAIHNVEFGRETEMMGDYYPQGTYLTTAEFEKRGCHPRTRPAKTP